MWTLFWIVSGLWNFSRGEWRACGEGHRQLKDVREADLVSTSESRYRHRFPIEVVEECVWLYFRFALSYRNIEEMMAKRGVPVTHETVRGWCHKFGSLYAAQLRKKQAQVRTKWHLDEAFVKMNASPLAVKLTMPMTSKTGPVWNTIFPLPDRLPIFSGGLGAVVTGVPLEHQGCRAPEARQFDAASA